MALRVRSIKTYLSKIIWGIIILVVGACLLRVYIWEKHYYARMEGSQRATSPATVRTQVVDETEVTVEQKNEYTVDPDKARYMTIPRLGIEKARVIEVGVLENDELDTPTNIFDIGWYHGSARPGQGGTAIYDAHNGGPNVEGVFKHLPDLQNDDIITIERGDGTIFNYRVIENLTIPLAEANNKMNLATRSPDKDTESITLISCTGEWSEFRQTYLSRQFVRAILAE